MCVAKSEDVAQLKVHRKHFQPHTNVNNVTRISVQVRYKNVHTHMSTSVHHSCIYIHCMFTLFDTCLHVWFTNE